MPDPTFEEAKAALRKLMDLTERAVLARRPEAEGFSYSFEQCCVPVRPFMVVFFDCSEGEMQNMVALRGYDDAYITFTSQLIRSPLSEREDEALRQAPAPGRDLWLLGDGRCSAALWRSQEPLRPPD